MGAQDASAFKELAADSRARNHPDNAIHEDNHRAKRPRLDKEPSPNTAATSSLTSHENPISPKNGTDSTAGLSVPQLRRESGGVITETRRNKIPIQSDDHETLQDTSNECRPKRRLPRTSATRSKVSKVDKVTMMKRLPGRSYANLIQSFLKLGKPNDSRPSSAQKRLHADDVSEAGVRSAVQSGPPHFT